MTMVAVKATAITTATVTQSTVLSGGPGGGPAALGLPEEVSTAPIAVVTTAESAADAAIFASDPPVRCQRGGRHALTAERVVRF